MRSDGQGSCSSHMLIFIMSQRNISCDSKKRRKRSTVSWVCVDRPDTTSQCNRGVRPRDYFREYCQNTSLHGLQYLGEKHRPLPERVCWLLVICVSLACCVTVIMMQWTKWKNSPVIVTFAESSTPAWQIPFPAVTICTEMRFKQSVFNYTDLFTKYNNGSICEQERLQLQYASHLCNFGTLHEGENTTDAGMIDFLNQIYPPIADVMYSCTWRSLNMDCRDLFSPVITDEGVCYTFNSLSAEELFTEEAVQRKYITTGFEHKTGHWTMEGGYDTVDDTDDTYPRRTASSGVTAGLSVFFNAHEGEFDSTCVFPIQGFKMSLHSPAVFPDVADQFFRVPSHRDVIVAVHPRMIKTSEKLKNYSPEDRKCFFEHEHPLRFFVLYTQENCETECFANFSLSICGCVAFYMPRDNKTAICGPGRRRCIARLLDKYNFDTAHHEECNCLPACVEIRYDVETSQSSYLWGKINKKLEGLGFGTVFVFLRDMQILTRQRNALYGISDFIANCGGLLGLFLGFSILSAVEIVYFLTLRLFLKIRESKAAKRNE